MEGELIDKIGRLDFRTQAEAFYTAYSKVLFPLPCTAIESRL